jgi:hypothetical protein
VDNLVEAKTAKYFHWSLRKRGMNSVLFLLSLGHHAFDFWHSLRSTVVNYYTVKWIHYHYQNQLEGK